MTFPPWRRLATGAVACAGTAVLVFAQGAQGTPPPGAGAFHLYLLGRDAGRETDTLSVGEGGSRHFESTFTYADRGADVRLTTTLDAGVDWSARHLTMRGQPFRDGTTDLDITVAGGRAQVRDRGAESSIDIGGGPFFPMDGAGPIGLQEQLIRYWRSHGRPKEIASAPGGPIHIEARADEQVDLGGRSRALERLAIEGPVWGRETAWVEPGGNLAALTTWVATLPLVAVRDGFESRLDRFLDEAARDRMAEFERINAAALSEYPEGVVLTGATVIVGGKRPPIPDATVVIRGDRIDAVGPSARTRPPADLPKVDARGMTIVAGLWDMQAPSPHVDWMPAYLAAGVTSVRSVTGQSAFLSALREVLAEGHSNAPRMMLAGAVDGGVASALGTAQVASADDGRQAVRRYRGDDFRQIEIGSSVSLPVLRAMALEAHRSGLVLSGSVPDGVTTAQALDAGLDQLESVPADFSTDAAMSAAMPLLVAHHTILEPLASWTEFPRRPAAVPIASFEPGVSRAPASIGRMLASLAGSATASDHAQRPSPVSLIRAARTAGVTVVAGSNGGVPGLSLIRELELFVQAGMTPLEALHTATWIPAQLMKMTDSGTVEAGKRADLVVLTGDPLANISNLRTAKWVVANGKLYDCGKLWKAAGFKN